MTESNLLAANPDAPATNEFLSDVVRGLSATHKQLDPKYFYDETGSRLFEEITRLPEYYITRTETGIMREITAELGAACGDVRTIVEFGSGSGTRSQILIGALSDANVYVPIDVSEDLMASTADSVHAVNPDMQVVPLIGDFTRPMRMPDGLPQEWLGYFPGSTIGNFLPITAEHFLVRVRRMLGANANLLIGVDLVKPTKTLELAYDDPQGVTSAFNKNILTRINSELDGTFDIDAFDHRATFNKDLSRIEMHLVSLRNQTVEIGDHAEIRFLRGETIHTENSHKYTIDGFLDLASQAGWSSVTHWTDAERLFSVHLLRSVA